MKNQEQQEKLSDLLGGKFSREEEERIIRDLESSGITRQEIDSLRSVSRLMDEMALPGPSERMDKWFYAMLDEEKKKTLPGDPEPRKKNVSWISYLTPGLRIAAGIALFLLGWFSSGWLGPSTVHSTQISDLTGEVMQLKETLVLTMMQQSSSVERIKAVNMTSEFEKADNRIVESLVGVLNHDSNDNVRLLALEALLKYTSIPEVRDGLVASIGNQTSPLVQLRLAEIMIALNEKRAAPEFQKVLQNANLNYNVRGKMNEAVGVLL